MSIVDVWANYAKIANEGYTQQQIADAFDVGRVMVQRRIALNSLPEKIKSFVRQGFLTEAHLTEITQLFVDEQFSQWLTQETIQLELCQIAANHHQRTFELI